MRSTIARSSLLLVALACAGLRAQSTTLRYVDDLPVVQATLRAGENSYPCHLLIDLSRSEPLFLHANAAQALGALECDAQCGDLVLKDLPVEGARDRFLEGFTARNAEGLHEVPLAGYLGRGAFKDGVLVLDGPHGKIELRSRDTAAERPPVDAARAVCDLIGSPSEDGVRIRVDLGSEHNEVFELVSKDGASHIRPGVAKAVGAPTGRLTRARAGTVDLARFVAFRPESPEGSVAGSLGGRALARMRVTIAFDAGWVAFEPDPAVAYPEDEAALNDALFGANPIDDLAAFLDKFKDSRFRAEAARARLPLVMESATDDTARAAAAKAAIEAAPEKGRAREALEILEHLADGPGTADLRKAIAEAGLPFAKTDEDGNAVHKLHVELGRLALARGDAPEAKRHLLSAVFGMPGDGPANLALGELHEKAGELERAQSRYMLAMLDVKQTAEEGYLALERLHPKLHGKGVSLTATIVDLAEGRVPALHPIPREPDEIHPTGKVMLAELFTGAMCPPCAAADVAFDALGELYGHDEIAVIEWHLPVPAPEPMVAPISEARAKAKGIRGTPTLILDGTESIVGGGKADQAGEMFAKYDAKAKVLLAQKPEATLSGSASIRGRVITLRARATGADGLRMHAVLVEDTLVFPGRNGILLHHHVARGAFTKPSGVPLGELGAGRELSATLDLDEVGTALDACIARFETQHPFRVRPTEPEPTALAVVVFLEDPARGGVVQAATLRVDADG
ncbi:MAG: hypothetical protein U1F36_20875 [Planctomycetota bacterium]